MKLAILTKLDEELMDTLMMLVPELEKEAVVECLSIPKENMSELLYKMIQEGEVSISDIELNTYFHKLKEGYPDYLIALINIMLDKPYYGCVEA